MSADFPSLDEMMKALDAAMPDHRWKGILQVLAIKGIADTRQLQDATGFARDKLMRALDRITGFSLEGSPLISRLSKTIKQPGDVKRPPAIYVLAEGGAKLLHPLGFPTAHAFGLMQDDHAMAHVLSMVSVHILAERAGVQLEGGALHFDVDTVHGPNWAFQARHTVRWTLLFGVRIKSYRPRLANARAAEREPLDQDCGHQNSPIRDTYLWHS